MRDEDLEKIKDGIREVIKESLHGDFMVPLEQHYKDHQFVMSLRSIWDKAVASTGKIMLVGIFLLLLGVGLFGIKFLGVKIP